MPRGTGSASQESPSSRARSSFQMSVRPRRRDRARTVCQPDRGRGSRMQQHTSQLPRSGSGAIRSSLVRDHLEVSLMIAVPGSMDLCSRGVTERVHLHGRHSKPSQDLRLAAEIYYQKLQIITIGQEDLFRRGSECLCNGLGRSTTDRVREEGGAVSTITVGPDMARSPADRFSSRQTANRLFAHPAQMRFAPTPV